MRTCMLITAIILIALIVPAQAGNSPWKYECRKDEMTDALTCAISTILLTEDPYDNGLVAALFVDEKARQYRLVFDNRTYCKEGMVRVDDFPAQSMLPVSGTCGYVWFTGEPFTEQLVNGSQLKVRIETLRDSRTYQVNLKGMKEAYQQMVKEQNTEGK